MMRNKKGGKLIIGGLLLLFLALALTGYNLFDEQRAAHRVDDVLAGMDQLVAEPGTAELPEDMIPDYQLAPGKDMPTVQVLDKNYAGYIIIPALELRLPVLNDWSYANLKYSPCRYAGTAYEDGFVICAHNYRSHFGRLNKLSIGDEIQFVDIDSNVFDYVVADMEQLAPSDTKEMLSDDWALSLFTCTRGGQFRLTVRCDRAD